jgi:hypothetical protein
MIHPEVHTEVSRINGFHSVKPMSSSSHSIDPTFSYPVPLHTQQHAPLGRGGSVRLRLS